MISFEEPKELLPATRALFVVGSLCALYAVIPHITKNSVFLSSSRYATARNHFEVSVCLWCSGWLESLQDGLLAGRV